MYIRIPDDLHARVKARAAEDGISMNHIAVSAIKSFLDSISVKALIGGEIKTVTLTFDRPEIERVSDLMKRMIEERGEWDTKQQKDG